MRKKLTNFLQQTNTYRYYLKGKQFYNDVHFKEVQKLNIKENLKKPSRTEIINYLLSLSQKDTVYLEIGVRNPADNFDKINASIKYSVDPGLEYELNPVDFRMTSDIFFEKLFNSEILNNELKFDLIFIDGLHLAEQVDQDIINSLKCIKDNGFIVLHDCNPPSEWHVREYFRYWYTPAQGLWNGTTWKAFFKWRSNPSINSCCIDSDWGVGILSKNQPIGKHTELGNQFFEFKTLDRNRKEHLNLIDFETFKKLQINPLKV